MNFRNSSRNWLINHPRMNPYNFSFSGTYRTLTIPIRILPDFLIIGFHKTATTSLYDYLIQHPNIGSATHKELHYFDTYFWRGLGWYKTHFPTKMMKNRIEKTSDQRFITGEATPNYVFYPEAHSRVKQSLPNVKLIVILRNPIDRAYSHYNYQKKLHRGALENTTFEEIVTQEIEKMNNDGFEKEFLRNFNLKNDRMPYVHLGIYVKFLKKWMNVFPKEQFHVIKTEELEQNPNQIINDVFHFLGLKEHTIPDLKKRNTTKYLEMKSETRKMLYEFYTPYNNELEKLLGMKFDWLD